RVVICTCSRTGRHLATFTRRPGSSLYTLTTASAQVAESSEVAALSHVMHSRLLVSGLPRSLPSLLHSPTLPCLPCVEGRQRAAPHSSGFPPTTAPLQTLHMDVWGPPPVGGTDQERYFLLVVDDYTRYTTVFPLRCNADVSGVLIPWIRATRRQLRERFCRDFLVLRLHSDRGGEFSYDLLADFCRDGGIRQSFTLPASPQKNGIAEHRIGLIMEVARTSIIHAAAPHFLWPFAVRYAAHQLNLWPRVSEPETLPTLRWTVKVGDASVFWVWGALSLVRDAKASKISSRTLRCVFLGFPTDALPWQFYHPRARQVFSSQDVTFDESVCFYRLHPLASHPVPLAPLFLVPVPPQVDPLPPLALAPSAKTAGAEPGGADTEGEGSGGATTGGDGSRGAATGGADSGGATSPSGGGAVGDPAGGPRAGHPPQPDLLETLSPQAIRAWIVRQGSPGGGGYGTAGARGVGVTAGGAAGAGCTARGAGGAADAGGTRGAVGAGGAGGTAGGAGGAAGTGGTAGGAGGAAATGGIARGAGGAPGAGVTRGAAGGRGAGAASPGGTGGGAGAGGAGATSPGGATSAEGAGASSLRGPAGTGGAGAAGPGGACTGGTGASGAGVAAGARGAGAASAGGARGATSTRGAGGGTGAGGVGAGGTRGAGVSGAGGTTGVAGTGGAEGTAGARGAEATEARGVADAGGATGAARAGGAGAAGAGGGGVAGTAPRRLFFYPQPYSSLPPPNSTGASTPVRARPLAVPGTHGMALRPSFIPQCVVLPEPPASSLPHIPDLESNLARAASPTVTRLLTTTVTDPNFKSTAAFSLLSELVDFAARSRLDYVASHVTESESVCPPSVGGEPALSSDVLEDKQIELECLAAALPRFASMLLCPEGDSDPLDFPSPCSYPLSGGQPWMQRWLPGNQHEPTLQLANGGRILPDLLPHPKDDYSSGQPSRGDLAAPPTWLHWVVPTGTQWSLQRLVYGLRQAPHEWHDTMRTTLAALGFAPSSANPSLFLRTDTTLPPFYVLVYVDDLVFSTTDTEALALVKAELQERHTCTDLGELRSYLGLHITQDRARHTITLTQSHMVHQVLWRFGFVYSSPQPTPLSTGHSLLAPPSDKSVDPSGPYPELVGCLMYLMAGTRPHLTYPLSLLAHYVAPRRHRKVHWDAAKRVLHYLCSTSSMGLVLGGRDLVVLTRHFDASWADDQATQRSSQGYIFILGSGSISLRSTRSSSVLGSSCEAEIYAGATAQELRWLTYLLTDLGERPRSPPLLYVDNKAMLSLCREQRLEHRMKHIALRYFLARELQQRG
ncbi:unnamed protein product, partial [Closterium sp. NIES-53]